MDTIALLIALILVATALLALRRLWPVAHTVREYERGLHFKHGRVIGEVGPGRYWLNPRAEDIQILDLRRRQLIVSGQEVLTADRVPLKLSLIVEFSVADVTKAIREVESYTDAVYSRAQLAVREEAAVRDLDTALADRGELGIALLERLSAPAQTFGLDVHAVHIRDFMMAGGLRNAYADVIQAKQEGLAALERARGEGAAVRSLANTARLIERNPGILKLRVLQAVQQGSGNRIVLSMDAGSVGADVRVEAEADEAADAS